MLLFLYNESYLSNYLLLSETIAVIVVRVKIVTFN